MAKLCPFDSLLEKTGPLSISSAYIMLGSHLYLLPRINDTKGEDSACVCVRVCLGKIVGNGERKEEERESRREREMGTGVVVDWMRHAHQKLSMNICKYDGGVWV